MSAQTDQAVARMLAGLSASFGANTRRRMALAVPAAILASSAVFRVEVADLVGTCRKPHLVAARHAAEHLLHACGLRLIDVSRAFDMDHGTVSHAFAKVDRLLDTDDDWQVAYEDLRTAYLGLGGPLDVEDGAVAVAPVLAGALFGRFSPVRVGHVVDFVAGALLAERRSYSAHAAAHGLLLLGREPRLRAIVDRVLKDCGHETYIPLVAERARKLGWYVEAA